MAKVVGTGELAYQSCVYTFVPAGPLPEIDLSTSLRGQVLPPTAHESIHRFLGAYHRPLLLGSAVAFILISLVGVVDDRTGQILSVVSIILWAPLGLGAFSTLRYDIVKLLAGTFDFWFFSFATTITAVLVSTYFRDLRFLRMVIDWVGFHHIVCIDAHVRGVRHFALMTIIGIPPVLFMLVWVMLGHVDGCTSFSILDHTNAKHHFHLSGVDLIGNGLMTLALFITKIAVRKWKAVQARRGSSIVQCVIYRCALKLVQLEVKLSSSGSKGRARRTIGHTSPRKPIASDPTIKQKMTFVKIPFTFPARSTVFPVKSVGSMPLSIWYLMPFYAVGVFGIGLSVSVLSSHMGAATDTATLARAWSALLWTLVFVVSFVALCQRQILKLLATSFDFLFYVIQISAANLCVCIMSKWDLSRCLMVLTWEIWFLWVLTLDALTPVIKSRLRFRVRYAIPVVALILLGHLVIMCRLFFVGDDNLQDTVLFEGTVWARQLVVRAIPFYFSRVVTLSLWCPRLIWRLAVAGKAELTLLRGAVCYDNCFSRRGRQSSRSKLPKPSWEKSLPKQSYRREQIAPAPIHETEGPTFSALTSVHPS